MYDSSYSQTASAGDAPVSVLGAQHSRLIHVVTVAGPCRLRDRDRMLHESIANGLT